MLKYGLIGLVVLLFSGQAAAENLTTWKPGDEALMRFFCNEEADLRDIIGAEDKFAMGRLKITMRRCLLLDTHYPIMLKRWVAGPFTDEDGESSIWAFGNEENEWFMWLMDNTGPN